MFRSVLIGRDNGFGESVVLIFPNNRVGIIDCAVDPKSRRPLPLIYLEDNSINTESVDFIILTHFHQDHYMGLSELLDKCQKARFFVPKVLSGEYFNFLINMLIQINGKANPYHEFVKIADVIRNSNRKMYTLESTSRAIFMVGSVEVTAHSPNHSSIEFFNNLYKSQSRALLEKVAAIPSKKRTNLQSIVVKIKVNNHYFLYGADQEYTNKPNMGWQPIMQQFNQENIKFLIFKIPHHGSSTGYNQEDWGAVLEKSPYLKLTPYSSSKLPSEEMIGKLQSHSDEVYSTSNRNDAYKNLPTAIRKKANKFSLDIKRYNSQTKGQITLTYEKNSVKTVISGSAVRL